MLSLPWVPQTTNGIVSSVLKTLSAFALSFGSTRLALEMGGGPPSLFWPTNGVIILFSIYSYNRLAQLSIVLSGICGIAVAQFHIVDELLGMKLGLASSLEIFLAIFLLEMFYDIPDKIQTFRSIVALFWCVSSVNCVIGATSGAFVITREFPDASFLEAWLDWFIGDVTGNFIVIYTWYMMTHSIKSSDVRSIKDVPKVIRGYFSISNTLSTCITTISVSMTLLAYCVKFPFTTVGIPFVLLTTPIIASMGLVLPPFVVGFIDAMLVIMIAIGTRNNLGPIYSVFSDLSQRDVFIGVQVTLLITYILSAMLSVVRHDSISREEALEKSVRDRVAFFSHISHELRTPLSVISGYTESMLKHEVISERVRDDLNSVMEASTTMTTTVNDLLNVFRSEGHSLDVQLTSVNMKDFSSSILSLVTQLSERKDISLDMTLSEDIPTNLLIDPRRVRQVMLNIIGNSIKYTPRGGMIRVCMEMLYHGEESRLSVSTQDSGVGIKEKDLPKLFNRFFRCEHTMNEQGTGLGLTVCQEIVRSMGGTMHVGSVFGSGTTFTFEIPTLKPDVECGKGYATGETSLSTTNPLQILVVEDSLLNQKLLKRILERHGHDVDSVMDGVSAVIEICKGKYDVVLLDLGLPLKSGIDVIRDIRGHQIEKVRDVPIIVTSGDAEDETHQICLDEGCNAFADKPFLEDDIMATLKKVTQIDHKT